MFAQNDVCENKIFQSPEFDLWAPASRTERLRFWDHIYICITLRVYGAPEAGDEFPRILCDPLPPVMLFYPVSLQSQGVGGHRVYVGIRHLPEAGIFSHE